MSRVREITRRTALSTALASILVSGCIFSPEVGELPPEPPLVIDSPEKLIEGLERAYRERDYNMFQKLLANDPDRNAEYLFLLSEPTEEGDDQWGFSEEARVHRRMFRPDDTLPGESPVDPEVWLETVDITLTPLSNFSERADLYSEDGGADGKLHPDVWRATEALYSTNVFFKMAGQTDYQVEGQANFVVIEDLAKSDGEAGQFLLFIWEDIPLDSKPDVADDPA